MLEQLKKEELPTISTQEDRAETTARLLIDKAECISNCLLMDKDYSEKESWKEKDTFFSQAQREQLVGKLCTILMEL